MIHTDRIISISWTELLALIGAIAGCVLVLLLRECRRRR